MCNSIWCTDGCAATQTSRLHNSILFFLLFEASAADEQDGQENECSLKVSRLNYILVVEPIWILSTYRDKYTSTER